jgi:hypothetical protein
VRQGLRGVRSAVPSASVWAHIEAELGPRPVGKRWSPWRLSLPMATLAGALFLMVLGFTGLTAGLSTARPANWADVTPQPVADQGLPLEELAIQPAVAPRPVTLALPPGAAPLWPPALALPGWHTPQVAFNRAPWPRRGGVVGSGMSEPVTETLLQ